MLTHPLQKQRDAIDVRNKASTFVLVTPVNEYQLRLLQQEGDAIDVRNILHLTYADVC